MELQLQHQSFQGIFRVDFLVLSPCCPRDSQESFPAPQFKSINSLALSLLYGPILTSVHDYWESHSIDYMDLCRQSDVSAFLIHYLDLASLVAQTVKNPLAVWEIWV